MKKVVYSIIFIFVFFSLNYHASAKKVGQKVSITLPGYGSRPNALLYLPWDYNSSGKPYSLIIFDHRISETSVESLPEQGLPWIIAYNTLPYALVNGGIVYFIILGHSEVYFFSKSDLKSGVRYLVSQRIHPDMNLTQTVQ